MTRTLSKDDKFKIKNYCDKIIFEEYHENHDDGRILPKNDKIFPTKDLNIAKVSYAWNFEFE
jgi:hypothetical protein